LEEEILRYAQNDTIKGAWKDRNFPCHPESTLRTKGLEGIENKENKEGEILRCAQNDT